MTELLTVAETALYLRVSERTVRHWVLKRRIPFLKAGALVRFRRSDLDAWLDGREKGGFDYAPSA